MVRAGGISWGWHLGWIRVDVASCLPKRGPFAYDRSAPCPGKGGGPRSRGAHSVRLPWSRARNDDSAASFSESSRHRPQGMVASRMDCGREVHSTPSQIAHTRQTRHEIAHSPSMSVESPRAHSVPSDSHSDRTSLAVLIPCDCAVVETSVR